MSVTFTAIPMRISRLHGPEGTYATTYVVQISRYVRIYAYVQPHLPMYIYIPTKGADSMALHYSYERVLDTYADTHFSRWWLKHNGSFKFCPWLNSKLPLAHQVLAYYKQETLWYVH